MDMNEIVEAISKMTLLETAELVKALEEKLGVSAAAPMAMAMPAGDAAAPAAEEKTEFNVELTSFGNEKIKVIKVIREITSLGLKEAKELVDGAPSIVKENIPKADAEAIKAKLEEVGATITIK